MGELAHVAHEDRDRLRARRDPEVDAQVERLRQFRSSRERAIGLRGQ